MATSHTLGTGPVGEGIENYLAAMSQLVHGGQEALAAMSTDPARRQERIRLTNELMARVLQASFTAGPALSRFEEELSTLGYSDLRLDDRISAHAQITGILDELPREYAQRHHPVPARTPWVVSEKLYGRMSELREIGVRLRVAYSEVRAIKAGRKGRGKSIRSGATASVRRGYIRFQDAVAHYDVANSTLRTWTKSWGSPRRTDVPGSTQQQLQIAPLEKLLRSKGVLPKSPPTKPR